MHSLPALSSLDAVVFDMDGTLVDSEGHYCRAYVHAMEVLGGWLTPDDYFRRFAGQTDEAIDRELHADLAGRVEISVIRRTWYDEYHRLRAANGVPLLPGAAELLELFARRGLPVAIASAAERRDIELNLDLAGIRDRVAVIASGEEVPRTKPAPDVYLLAAQRLGADPARCLAFEDTNTGARAAIAAGMPTCMVPHQCQADSFVRHHARAIAPSLADFLGAWRPAAPAPPP